MEDEEGKKNEEDEDNDPIDEFTITPSLSGVNNVTLTGKEQLATISISYQIHCMNLSACPTPSLSPTSKQSTLFCQFGQQC